MKRKIQLLAILLFSCFAVSYSQQTVSEVSFTYDAAGNRTSVNVVYVGSSTKSAAKNDIEKKVYNDALGDQKITILPNPTQGQLAVKVDNLDTEKRSQIDIYNTIGVKIKTINGITDYNEIDLTDQPNATYIMVIQIGDNRTKWKIIKQ